MRNVFAVIAAILLSLSILCERGQCQARPPIDFTPRHIETRLGGQEATGIDLYVKPDKPDGKKVDRRKADPKKYPTLYSKAREKGVIVVFGAPWCGWCKVQLKNLPEGYRVLYVDVENKTGPNWRALMTKWEVVPIILDREAPTFPTTVIAVDGTPAKHWLGFKPWRILKKDCTKAKESKKDEEVKPKNGHRSDGGGSYYNTSPCCNRRRYVPKFGRWSRR